jgi:hypothetical protein
MLIIVNVVIVIGGMHLNAHPHSNDKDKMDRIPTCMRNQECVNKAIQKRIKTLSQEMTKARQETVCVKE